MLPQDGFIRESFARLRDFRLYLANPSFGNPTWEHCAFRVLILRLSPFEDVARSTPHIFLAREVRRALPDAYIDMAFLPSTGDARLLEADGLPLVIGTQSLKPLGDFHLVLVSNAYLLEMANLPFLLGRSGVPVWASARDSRWPPLILGGSNAAAAHAFVSGDGDCMADAIFFGEGEGGVGRIAGMCRRLSGLPKAERLRAVAEEVSGLWPAGDLSRPVAKSSAATESLRGQGEPAPVLPGPEAATARLSITLGCPCMCSFCFEGHDRKPFRAGSLEELLAAARRMKASTGASTLEISSFNFNTHPDIAPLLAGLHRLFFRVNLMSQRADILARTPRLLDLEIAADKRSFTLGIEGVSERLRRFLHKSLGAADICKALEILHARSIREVKLFYILTGRETSKDIAEFSGFVKGLKQSRRKAQSPPRLLFSFGMLVRMPFTPLRHDPPVLEEKTWRPIAGSVKSICETNGFEFRLASPWPDFAATQVLALENEGGHALLARIAEKGCMTGSGLPPGAEEVVRGWIAERGKALSGEKALGHPFGFPFLDGETTRAHLHRQYEKAMAEQDDGYCRSGSEEGPWCADCIGCTRETPGPAGAAARVAAARVDAERADAGSLKEVDSLVSAKRRMKKILVRVRIPREAAGFGAEWIDAWLARRLFARHPRQVENVLWVREVLLRGWERLGEDTAWFGETAALVAAWDPASVERLLGGGEGAFLGPLDLGEPAGFQSLSLRLELPAPLFAEPGGRLADFCAGLHAPLIIRRTADGSSFEVPEKTRKKKMIFEGSCAENEEGARMRIVVGPRFPLGDFLRSFGGRECARRALVEVEAFR